MSNLVDTLLNISVFAFIGVFNTTLIVPLVKQSAPTAASLESRPHPRPRPRPRGNRTRGCRRAQPSSEL